MEIGNGRRDSTTERSRDRLLGCAVLAAVQRAAEHLLAVLIRERHVAAAAAARGAASPVLPRGRAACRRGIALAYPLADLSLLVSQLSHADSSFIASGI